MDAFFGPAGRLSGALAGFEPRPEQEALATEVASALESRDHHVAEAGTGTGKSHANHVPAPSSRAARTTSAASASREWTSSAGSFGRQRTRPTSSAFGTGSQ